MLTESRPSRTTVTAETADALPDILFVSMESWDEVWRRNQFFVAEFARRSPGRRVLFVGLDTDVTHSLRRGKVAILRHALTTARTPRPVPGTDNVFLFNPVKWLPNTLTIGRKLNERYYRKQVAAACRQLGIVQPLLWLNPHYAVHMVGQMNEQAVVYDITDDWALANFQDWEKRLIEAQDRELCQKANLVVVCSEALAESHRPLCKNLLLVPNGVNVENYQRVAEAKAVLRDKWTAPVFGYTGTLHPDRIDHTLVIALARAFPQGSVVLVGPNMLSPATMEALNAEPNIYLTGPVPYAEIANTMMRFDVCIVPHQESEFVESLNPIKLWEYLASGKPIASVNVAGFRDYAPLCKIGSGPEGFVAACRAALDEGETLREARVAEAAQNTWRSRVDRLVEALQKIGIARHE